MSTDPIDLDATELLAAGSHDPVMALQARALVAEVRRLRAERNRCRCSCHDCCVPLDASCEDCEDDHER